MESFGTYLLGLLKRHDLKQEAMCQWLSRRTGPAKKPSAIKEHLRQLRNHDVTAHRYPLSADIVQYFEAMQLFDAASRIRHILWQQTYDSGLGPRFLEGGPNETRRVAWLYFPVNDQLEMYKAYSEWKAHLRGGDFNLYRSTSVFFQHMQLSVCHIPVRRAIALPLAKASSMQGDYPDAYFISKRFENAFIHQYGKLGLSRQAGKVAASEDVYDYIDSLIVQADAISHLVFYAPYTASIGKFITARKILEFSFKSRALEPQQYFALLSRLRVRKLRMTTRATLASQDDELFTNHFKLRLESGIRSVLNSRPNKDDLFLVNDTLARASALLGHHSDALQYYRIASEVARLIRADELAIYGDISVEREYRLMATELLAKLPNTSLHDQERMLHSLIRLIHPENMRHSRQIITPIENRIIDIYRRSAIDRLDRGQAQSLNVHVSTGQQISLENIGADSQLILRLLRPEDDALLAEVKETIKRLDAEASRFAERFFDVSTSDYEHYASLEQANQLKLA